MGSFPMTLSDL